MKKALVAISDYESGDRLLKQICGFFDDWVTEIHLLAVIDNQNIEYLASFRDKDKEEVLRDTKIEIQNTLEKLAKTYADSHFLITSEIKEGLIAETIVETSKEEHIDFIVMGTKRVRITKRLLKNNVRYVIEISNTPVLLFPV